MKLPRGGACTLPTRAGDTLPHPCPTIPSPQVGDIICEVDGKSIKGMKPEAVAALMAGELGSYVVIKSVSGVVARIKRDISAGQKSP